MLHSIAVFLLGGIIGYLIKALLLHFCSGRGYFRVTRVPEEDELYTVNVRLEPNQQLHKKETIILIRERNTQE